MNNPYRARPSKPRGESTAVPNNGVPKKPSWPGMTGGEQHGEMSSTISSNLFQAQKPTVISSPPNMSGDPWDWGNDHNRENGNDVWNWSVDQAHELQIQQQSVPTYPNSGQACQTPIQNTYYNNSNESNRSIPLAQPVPSLSGENTLRTVSRESTRNVPQDHQYSQYSNYGGKQQQMHTSTCVDSENKNSAYHYISQHQQHQIQGPQCNWDGAAEKSKVISQETWQNQVQSAITLPQSTSWQNSSTENDSSKTINNQWRERSQQPENSQFNSPSDSLIQESDELKRRSSRGFHHTLPLTPQWQDENQRKPSSNVQHRASHNISLVEAPHHSPQINQSWKNSKENALNQFNETPLQKVDKFVVPSMHFFQSQVPKSSLMFETNVSAVPSVSQHSDIHSQSFATSAGPLESSSSNNSPQTMEQKKNRNSDRINYLSSSINQMNLNETHQFSNQQIESQPRNFHEISPEKHRSFQVSHSSAQSQLFHDMNTTSNRPQPDQVLQNQPSTNNQAQSGGIIYPQPEESHSRFNEYPPPEIQTINHQEFNSRANKPIPPTSIVRPVQEHDSLPPQQINVQTPNISHEHSSQHMNYDQWYNDNRTHTSQSSSSASQNNWFSNNNEIHPPLPKHWTPPPTSTPSGPPTDSCEIVQSPVEGNWTSTQDDARTELRTSDIDPMPTSHFPYFQQPSVEQEPLPSENFEFASNDRNTFLETGELTDSHHDQESVTPSQDEDNDEVPSDIPFLREVPGQSSNPELSRNDPTGQEQYIGSTGSELRDIPPGEECRDSNGSIRDTGRVELDFLERRNDPSGRARSLPPAQSRNDPSGEERIISLQPTPLVHSEPNEIRQVPGSGIISGGAHSDLADTDSGMRQIPGGISPSEGTLMASTKSDDNNSRVVTGSQEYSLLSPIMNIQETREEAVGASMKEVAANPSESPKCRDSYEDGDDEESGNSRDGSRDRRERRDLRDSSPIPLENRRRYDRSYYEHDRDRACEDDYYYDRRRPDYDRPYKSREDLDHRDASYRSGDRGHRVDDNDDAVRRGRVRGEEERDGRVVGKRDERRSRRDKSDDARRRDRNREMRDYYVRDGRDTKDPRARDFSDADRRRHRFEDYDRDHRREYYDDPYSRSSRPSSRSSYNDRDRDYFMRPRDPYYGYNGGYAGYDYGPNYNTNYYAYLENLRRTNPSAYMEWYNKYYANHSHQQQQPKLSRAITTYPEDRASVHSGQSSCDDRTGSGKFMTGDTSLMPDPIITSRMTPTKFSTSHVQGLFSIGSLVHVHASYPADGERAKVDILTMDSVLLHDPIVRELRSYPGPLIKGVTHKKTIIEYCESKIKTAAANDRLINRASYVLLYQLMITLIQQNGNVVGVDIAALLLRNKESYPYDANEVAQKREFTRQTSAISQRSSVAENESEETLHAVPESPEVIKSEEQSKNTVEQVTNGFRNTLLYGLVQEALEYAMSEGLWGHALFLASKLDKRTHASVMTRFANSLPAQDPLQTLYQLHSGRVPASVTCVADCKWDDWRPHLAMIISNTSVNPEINRKSITTMGDTMAARGDIFAAHFCYILAEIDFGNYGKLGTKLVLIGANHNTHYKDFVTLEAVMLTEIYEYARSLSESSFTLIALQAFKFENALKMIDYGLVEKGLLYLERIAVNIVNSPSKFKSTFITSVYKLSERIKFHDPVFKDFSIGEEISLTWLDNLSEIVSKYQTGEITTDIFQSREILADSQESQQIREQGEMQQYTVQNQRAYPSNHQEYKDGGVSMMEVYPLDANQEQWQQLSTSQSVQYNRENADLNNYQFNSQPSISQESQKDYWGQQQTFNHQEYIDWQHQQLDQGQNYQTDQTNVDSTQSDAWNYELQPQISMGPSSRKQYDPLEELDAIDPMNVEKSAEGKKSEKSSEKKSLTAGSGSWFGGLFSKLTPKPKNQMILPDDSNPTIIWDPVAKKWTNKDEKSDIASSSLAPPPKVTDMSFHESRVQSPTPLPPQPSLNLPNSEEAITPDTSKMMSGNNMFKLQKGRGMRANYIDVMNPNASKGNIPPIPTPAASPLVPMAASSPQMFVPAPVNDPDAPLNFLTQTPAPMSSQENTFQEVDSGNAVAK